MNIIRNSARCRKCNDEIESKYRHDYVTCNCGAISVDGGRAYLRRRAKDDIDDVIETSVFEGKNEPNELYPSDVEV